MAEGVFHNFGGEHTRPACWLRRPAETIVWTGTMCPARRRPLHARGVRSPSAPTPTRNAPACRDAARRRQDSIFTKGPADVLDHATSEIAIGSKLGINATKKLPGEDFKRPWPPFIKMDAAVKAKVEQIMNTKR